MKRYVAMLTMACILVAGCRTTQTSTPGRLTEFWLEQVSTALERATFEKDTETLLAHLASNVVVEVSFPKNPRMPSFSFTRETYATHLRESWPRTDSVGIQRLSTHYDISPDGQSAMATSVFRQTTRMKGSDRDIVSTCKEVSTINLVDGIPKATRSEVTITFKKGFNQ
jgi:hypothetical protein